MKLSLKIFFTTYITVILFVGIGSFILTEANVSSLNKSCIDNVLSYNEYAGKTFISIKENSVNSMNYKKIKDKIFESLQNSNNYTLNILKLDEIDLNDSLYSSLKNFQQGSSLSKDKIFKAVFRIDLNNTTYFIETASDFTDLYNKKNSLFMLYYIIVLSSALISGISLLIISNILTSPLKELSSLTKQISNGEYEKRIPIKDNKNTKNEISLLSINFNEMADAVQTNIKKLEKTIQNREMFISDFTHELKTPMTSIIGYADLLRSYDLDKEEQKASADAIYKESKRLEKLSIKLLDLIVLNSRDISLQTVNSIDISESLNNSCRFLSKKYNLSLNIDCDESYIYAEESLLLSLLYNLTDNACKASEENSTVKVIGRLCENNYTFSVIDNGCGIKKEDLEKISEPFFMVDKSRSKKRGGTGLGLALCKKISELHQTKLIYESEINKGTKVSFTLKTAEPENTL